MVKIPDSYVAVDIETTGLNPKTDKIIEIAAVFVQDGQVKAEKSTLVNPRQKLSEYISQLTGIRDEMLEDAPDIQEVIGDYAEFCRNLPLLGHNVMFDYRFLKKAAVNRGIAFDKEGIDTLFLSRKFMPPDQQKNLSSACQYFHVEAKTAHRALGDAYGAHDLYQALARRYGESGMQAFSPKPLIYKIKKERLASKRQKEVLHELLKYHKIEIPVQIDYLSGNEISRITDKIISQHGRINCTKA